MKNIKVLIALFFFGLLLNPTSATAQISGAKRGGNLIKFDKAKFETEVKKSFDGNAKGYQVILLKNGQIVSEMAGGKARNQSDGLAEMTVNTPANIGSTAKFFGGTALLHEFQQKPSPIGGGMESWLSQQIYKYFPLVWQKNMHASIKQITFRDLLQHKSGFIQSDKDAKVYFDYLAKGVSSDKTQDFYYGKSKYANANITSVGYLLAIIDDPSYLKKLNQLIAEKNVKPDDVWIQTYLGNIFESYMKGKIFNATKPQIHPSCDAENEYPAKNIIYAKTYLAANDVFKGTEYSKADNFTKACHAAGGWYISARELAAYVANFAATETIVSNETRKKMFDDDAPQNRLVWSFTANDSSLAKNFKWNSTPYMGGDHGGSHGTIMMLPDDYYAVGIVNSDISPANKVGQNGGSAMLTRNIMEAFKAGVANNF